MIEASLPRRLVTAMLIKLVSVLAANSSIGHADEVVVHGSTSTSRITINCEVLDYTGKRLVIKTAANKNDQTYSAADVVSVRTMHNDAHESGLKALAAGDTDAAEAAFDRAINQELRTWVRRELLAFQIRCSLRRSDWVTAGQRFSRLYQSDPDTRHIDLLPLSWSPRPADNAAVRGQAAVWLRDKQQPVTQLLAASWLCFEPKYDAECEQVWPSLVRLPDERLRTLAQWQSYRRRAAIEGIEDTEIARWESRVSKLEPPMRAGPYFMLGLAFERRHEFDLAAAAFLRLPFAHPTDHPVTAEALLNASHCLEKTGLSAEAESLRQELITKFRHTPSATKAEEGLRKR